MSSLQGTPASHGRQQHPVQKVGGTGRKSSRLVASVRKRRNHAVNDVKGEDDGSSDAVSLQLSDSERSDDSVSESESDDSLVSSDGGESVVDERVEQQQPVEKDASAIQQDKVPAPAVVQETTSPLAAQPTLPKNKEPKIATPAASTPTQPTQNNSTKKPPKPTAAVKRNATDRANRKQTQHQPSQPNPASKINGAVHMEDTVAMMNGFSKTDTSNEAMEFGQTPAIDSTTNNKSTVQEDDPTHVPRKGQFFMHDTRRSGRGGRGGARGRGNGFAGALDRY